MNCMSCNKSTGICDNGCGDGWKGDYCETGEATAMSFLKVVYSILRTLYS